MRTFSGGRNTVPQVFFNSEHLGGNDDLQKMDKDGIFIRFNIEAKIFQTQALIFSWLAAESS